MGKWIGGVLQIIAAVLFVIAGDANSVGMLLPAIGTGLGGLWIFDRSDKMERPPPVDGATDRELLKEVERVQHVLGVMQRDVESLTEDREFYRRLYSGEKAERES